MVRCGALSTERLYLRDPFFLAFEARVARVADWEGKPAVVLDASAFYPEGGGQLADEGTLLIEGISLRVRDVQIDDRGEVFHLIEPAQGELAILTPGARVSGAVDAKRRRDHMSQHTGQHMLSRALLEVAGAETISSRLGAHSATIDVPVASLDERAVQASVDRVNEAVLEDRPIRVLFPSPEQLATLPLRRQPKVSVGVRLIDIEGIDLSPCGGTHCTSTGQVGPVHVTSLERYKGGTRITFLAGVRTILDYHDKDATLRALAKAFSCGPLDVMAAVNKLRSELKMTSELLGSLRAELASRLAERLLSEHPVHPSGITRIALLREGDDIAALRMLAGALCRRDDVVALVGSRESPGAEIQIVVERGKQASFDAGRWLKETAQVTGGRGGGRAERAEGRLPGSVDWRAIAER